jgi:nitroreductase
MIELLISRRSIRDYTEQPIEKEKIDILKQAALLSPTGKNKREWEYIFVDERETLAKLATVKPHGIKMLEKAALGIVVCADEEISDIWIEDASIAMATLHYTAHALGLGSCWIQIRNRMFHHEEGISSEKKMQEMLNIPEKMRVLAILSVGYPADERAPNQLDKLDYSKIHTNKY